MTVGAFASATGMGLLAMAVALHGLPIFLLATAMAGAGYSLLFLSALQVIHTAAPAQHRGAVLSALYLFAFLSMGSSMHRSACARETMKQQPRYELFAKPWPKPPANFWKM